MDNLLLDIRYGLRSLLKSPAFTLIAILSLGLGIGANTAMFSITDALLLRNLPVYEPRQLVLFGDGRANGIFGGIQSKMIRLVSEAELAEVRKARNFFDDAAGIFSLRLTEYPVIGGAPDPERIDARMVTGNYFSTLGAGPALGRVFTDAVDRPMGAHPEVVISHAYWTRRFGASPAALGQTLRIAGTSYSIIGVTAPGFSGTTVGESPDAWFPLSMQEKLPPYFKLHDDKMLHSLHVFGRLKHGVNAQQASAGMTLLFKQLLTAYAGTTPTELDRRSITTMHVELTPFGQGSSGLRRFYSTPLLIISAVVVLVLLIACANLANLLLARATARQREMSIRLAIGSGRLRVVRQLLTESVLLSLAGSVVGVIFAMWGTQILMSLVSAGSSNPVALNVSPNLRVFAFTFGVALVTGLLFGIAPAMRASSVDPGNGLKQGRSGTGTRSRMFAGRALVVAQVTLSLLLLVGAGLFIRSFRNLASIDTGFDQEHLLVFGTDADSAGYKEDGRLTAMYRKVEENVSHVPGVEAAAFSMFSFNGGAIREGIQVEGHPELAAQGKSTRVEIIGPGYFEATGLPVVQGRALNDRDTAASRKVTVISETTAREIFGSEPAIGKTITLNSDNRLEIVGVAKDAKHSQLREDPDWAIYVPDSQMVQYLRNLLVRVHGPVAPVIPEVRRGVASADKNLPVSEVVSMRELVTRSINNQRMVAQLSAFFGGLALLLAAIGLYGVLSYSVAQRTPEIGVRMALGAGRPRVLWMILGETLVLIAAGVGVGVPAAMLLSRFVESLLFGLKGTDVATTAGAISVLALIGCVAGLVPALRASKVDPMVALRYE